MVIFGNWKTIALMGLGMILLHAAIRFIWRGGQGGLAVYGHWGAAALFGLGIAVLHFAVISLMRPTHALAIASALLGVCVAAIVLAMARFGGRAGR